MNINIKATNTTLTPAITEYITEKLVFLDKFIGPEEKVRVEVEVDKKHKSGLVYRAEVEMQPHGYFADARGNELYEAIDLVVPKIKEQVTRKKSKKVTLRRKSARAAKGK